VSDEHNFLLQRVQPAMVGLIDGSLSTLAPIFSIALVSHKPFYAFVGGLATSIGAGMFIGGILHSLPFLIPEYHAALVSALVVVAFELVALAALRAKFFATSFTSSLAAVSLAGAVIVAISAAIGGTA